MYILVSIRSVTAKGSNYNTAEWSGRSMEVFIRVNTAKSSEMTKKSVTQSGTGPAPPAVCAGAVSARAERLPPVLGLAPAADSVAWADSNWKQCWK